MKGGLTYGWDKKSTYVQNPPYFVGMGRHPAPLTDIVDARVLCLLLDSITTDHISPAGSIKIEFAGGQVSHRPQGQAGRFQSVRYAPRQSRGDDARHLRQYPPQEPDGARRRGRRDRPLSVTPAHVDLRRRHALQERQGSARRFRRQGIRQRILARLGGEGTEPARRACGRSPSRSSASIART